MKRTASPGSPMFESMHKFYCRELTIRVWREEETLLSTYERGDLIDALRVAHGTSDLASVSLAFHRCERVTAVEVLDKNGNGSVTYTVWP